MHCCATSAPASKSPYQDLPSCTQHSVQGCRHHTHTPLLKAHLVWRPNHHLVVACASACMIRHARCTSRPHHHHHHPHQHHHHHLRSHFGSSVHFGSNCSLLHLVRQRGQLVLSVYLQSVCCTRAMLSCSSRRCVLYQRPGWSRLKVFLILRST